MKTNILVILISTIISVGVFVGGLFLYHKTYDIERYKYETVSTVNTDDEHTLISGVIRNEGDDWYVIEDDTHKPIGINDISQDGESVIVWYDTMEEINSISVTVDETMAEEGYTVGASVAVDKATISIFDGEGNVMNPKDYSNKLGNIWIQGVFKR